MPQEVEELARKRLAAHKLLIDAVAEEEHGDAAVHHLGDGAVDGEEEHGVRAEGLVEEARARGAGPRPRNTPSKSDSNLYQISKCSHFRDFDHPV